MNTFLHIIVPIAAVFLPPAAYLWHAHRADRQPGRVFSEPSNVKRIGEWRDV